LCANSPETFTLASIAEVIRRGRRATDAVIYDREVDVSPAARSAERGGKGGARGQSQRAGHVASSGGHALAADIG
jgi:hypothetical protein